MQDSDNITTLQKHLDFSSTLKKYIQKKSKQDFLTYVRMVVPIIITDSKRGMDI